MQDGLALRARGVGKDFLVGTSARGYETLRERLTSTGGAALRGRRAGPASAEKQWLRALDELTFDVREGEAVGFIGHNGAGKSTLLKLISRITPPTRGLLEVRGRVGTLLEVGTGFHPELTGRENVYLNGAILGMSRSEISRHFAAIVAFADVERFLDVPVKRYSSGMHVRLAFSVAAHLDPELLIVDEVLAVGDSAFQRACIARLQDAVKEGRTVLFVSHNMGIVSALCTRGIVLEHGRLIADAPVDAAVGTYLRSLEQSVEVDLLQRQDRAGWHEIVVKRLTVCGEHGVERTGMRAWIEVQLTGLLADTSCRLVILNSVGQAVATLDSSMAGPGDADAAGDTFVCELPELPLAAGTYRVDVTVRGRGQLQDELPAAAYFDVEPGPLQGRPAASGYLGNSVIAHSWRRP